MDPAEVLSHLASADPRVRLDAEERLRAAGREGRRTLGLLVAAEGAPEALRRRAADVLGDLVREASVEAFRLAVPEPSRPDLWAGAVAIAAEGDLDVDAAEADRTLASLVERARAAVPEEASDAERVAGLTSFLFRDAGFRGNRERYDDPRNSYVPDVLARRTGIPVTLSVLWMSVAKGLGLRSFGVGLPLHFVVRCDTDDGTRYVDSFHGEVLDEAGCRRLISKAAGREVRLPDSAFRPLNASEVLLRMLRNLRAIHEGAGNLHAALAAIDRTLWLTPLDARGWCERSVALARLSRPAAAARALSQALALDPDASDRHRLHDMRKRLLRAAAERN